jgi:hypothetical protein
MPIAAPDRVPSTFPSSPPESSPGPSPPVARHVAANLGGATETSPFAQLVGALGREAERGERTVRGVLRGGAAGRDYGPSELLALQAGIYRYGETVDLAAKLVDKVGTDIRTVLQGQQ